MNRNIVLVAVLLLLLSFFNVFLTSSSKKTMDFIDQKTNARTIEALFEVAKTNFPEGTPQIELNLLNQPKMLPYYSTITEAMVLPVGHIFIHLPNNELEYNPLFNNVDAEAYGDMFVTDVLLKQVNITASNDSSSMNKLKVYRRPVEFLLTRDNKVFIGGEN